MPIIVPVKLKISDSGASVMPSESSSLFTAPLRPSRIIHEKVRTRKLVQNGIRTQDGEDIPGPRARRREEVRDRIAGKEREGRGPGRDLQRDAERPQVHRRRRRPQVVLGRQLAGPVDQAEPQDLQDGVEEERDDQEQQRVERPGADPAGARQRRPGTAATGLDRGCHATPSTSVWSPRHPTRMRVPGGGTAAPPSVSCFRDSTRSSAIDT